LPSIRVISSQLQINHITVSKSYHELVAANLIEKQRGLGMFVKQGAIQQLTIVEQESFLNDELPKLLQRMKQLKINRDDVIELIKNYSEGEQ